MYMYMYKLSYVYCSATCLYITALYKIAILHSVLRNWKNRVLIACHVGFNWLVMETQPLDTLDCNFLSISSSKVAVTVFYMLSAICVDVYMPSRCDNRFLCGLEAVTCNLDAYMYKCTCILCMYISKPWVNVNVYTCDWETYMYNSPPSVLKAGHPVSWSCVYVSYVLNALVRWLSWIHFTCFSTVIPTSFDLLTKMLYSVELCLSTTG